MSTIPTYISLVPFIGPILDQQDQGSCEPNCYVDAINLIKQEQGLPAFNGSRDFLYYNAQTPMKVHNISTGTYPIVIQNSLMKDGIAPESMWGYNDANAVTKAPDAVYTEAAKHTMMGIEGWNDTPYLQSPLIVQWIIDHLKQGKPCEMEIDAKGWLLQEHGALNTLNPANDQNSQVLGGHCLLAVGYDSSLCGGKGGIIVQNSWGTGYGDGGLEVYPVSEITIAYTNANGVNNLWGLHAITGFDGVDQTYSASKAQVSDAFTTILQRAPEAAAFNYFSNLLDTGKITLAQMYDGIFNSPEAQITFGSMTHSQIVTQMYHVLLNREPDAAGLSFYVNRLDTGACTAGQMFQQTVAAIKNISSGSDLIHHDYMMNKEDMGEYYGIAMQVDGTHGDIAHNIISQVTDDANACQVIKVGIPTLLGHEWNVHQ